LVDLVEVWLSEKLDGLISVFNGRLDELIEIRLNEELDGLNGVVQCEAD
jgi:hypothetical protein